MSSDMVSLGRLVKKITDLPDRMFGTLCDLVEKLGGKDGGEWLVALGRFLRKENPWGAKKLVLKNLKLVTSSIPVAVNSFTKDSFFGESGPAKLYFGDNFRKWVLSAIPETVPAFACLLMKTKLTKLTYDSEILSELRQSRPLSVPEFAAVIRDRISRQPQGQAGKLLTNGYANIFYVKVADERVVAVYVDWYAERGDWNLNADDLDDDGWIDGHCVFSRS